MRGFHSIRQRPTRRRAAAVVSVAIGTPVLLGFAALSIDVGYLYMVKAQLQNAADAAALAGGTVYFSNAGLTQDAEALRYVGGTRARAVAERNKVLGRGLILEAGDITFGQQDDASPGGPLLVDQPWDAVHVTARRTRDSVNGPVPLFFAAILGKHVSDVSTVARVVASDRVAGYGLHRGSVLLPFTISLSRYQSLVENGPDEYGYDGSVLSHGDGIPEVWLFPWKWSDTTEQTPEEQAVSPDGAGNFGTLNVGIGSQSTAGLETQIRTGVTAEELRNEFGTSELVFYDDEHTLETGPRTYYATGNPGVTVSLEDDLQFRVGDVIGFFLHRQVTLSGSNSVFEICGLAFGRVVAVNIRGRPDERALVIQPTAYSDSNVIIDEDAPSTHGQLGRVILVR